MVTSFTTHFVGQVACFSAKFLSPIKPQMEVFNDLDWLYSPCTFGTSNKPSFPV